jgi:integrase
MTSIIVSVPNVLYLLGKMVYPFSWFAPSPEMGAPEIQTFLSYVANERNASISTHHQALCALLFLYKNVLQIELPWLDNVHRPPRPVRRPTVLARRELELVFAQMEGVYLLIARLLYGTGMRLMECAQLRVKDVAFQRWQDAPGCFVEGYEVVARKQQDAVCAYGRQGMVIAIAS